MESGRVREPPVKSCAAEFPGGDHESSSRTQLLSSAKSQVPDQLHLSGGVDLVLVLHDRVSGHLGVSNDEALGSCVVVGAHLIGKGVVVEEVLETQNNSFDLVVRGAQCDELLVVPGDDGGGAS